VIANKLEVVANGRRRQFHVDNDELRTGGEREDRGLTNAARGGCRWRVNFLG
jgi:hypothetical protein